MNAILQLEVTAAAITSRIANALTSVCSENLGTSLRSLVLTGSAARGEITYRVCDGHVEMLSDVEAFAVLLDSSPLPTPAAMSQLCRRAEARLQSEGIHVHVSLSCVHASYFRELPPHIFTYELRTCGVVLVGDKTVLNDIPMFAESEISQEDAWRLLSNRLVESLRDSTNDGYPALKLCLDLATSLLVFFGRFEAGYAARERAMERLVAEVSEGNIPVPAAELLPVLRKCTNAKLNSSSEAMDEQSANTICAWAWQAWAWELAQLTGARTEPPEEMIRALGHKLPWSSRLRGWAFTARRIGWPRSIAHWPRWCWLFAKGFTPRYAVYLSAYECRAGAANNIRDLLPVRDNGSDAARQIEWNYKEFVVDTRA